MTVDMGRMKKSHQEQQRGGDFGSFEEGETLLYVCPPCRDNDEWDPTKGLNYVPLVIHYKLGPKDNVAASLDPASNPIMNHPFVKKELKKKGKWEKIRELEGECPIAKAIDSGKISDPDESRAQTKYLWNMIPLGFRKKSSDEWNMSDNPKVTPFMLGKSLYEGIMEAFFDEGDITDPDAAVLIRVVRKGAKLNTKYTVKVEPSSLKKRTKLSSKMKAAMAKALAGDCDLFRLASEFFKTPAEIKAMLSGMATTSDPDEDDPEDDEEEVKRESKKSSKSKPPVDDDDDEDEDDEDEDEKPKKGKKAPVEEDEDEDDEDDEEEEKPKKKGKKAPVEEDEDEEEDEKPKKKGKAVEPDEDEDDDEDEKPKKKGKAVEPEDDEDDEEEEKPKKKGKKAPVEEEEKPKKKGKKSEPAEEEEDVDGLDELEKELSELDGKSKKSKKSKVDEDEDDDEDEKPKKKSKKSKVDEDEDDD